MPNRTIDDLLEAEEAVQILKDTTARHDRIIARLVEMLEDIQARLTALERSAG